MSDKINMSVDIAGVTLKNPITVASGTFGSGMEYSEFVDLSQLGAVTTKGVANVPWPGNPTPRIAETYGGMMNAIGLQNPGIDVFKKRDIPFLRDYDTKIIVNVCGKSKEDYVDCVEKLGDCDVDLLEINVSCPNVKEGGIAAGCALRYNKGSQGSGKAAYHHEAESECHRHNRDGQSCRGWWC